MILQAGSLSPERNKTGGDPGRALLARSQLRKSESMTYIRMRPYKTLREHFVQRVACWCQEQEQEARKLGTQIRALLTPGSFLVPLSWPDLRTGPQAASPKAHLSQDHKPCQVVQRGTERKQLQKNPHLAGASRETWEVQSSGLHFGWFRV